MKKIDLKDGNFTLVDDEDYEYLNQWKWKLSRAGYATRSVRARNDYKKWETKSLHSLILLKPKGLDIDHINGDKLDNRKQNLRIATRSQNLQNQRIRSNNTSGYKGVDWRIDVRKWRVRIKISGKRIELGYFGDIELAAQSYNKAAQKYFGEFARLN